MWYDTQYEIAHQKTILKEINPFFIERLFLVIYPRDKKQLVTYRESFPIFFIYKHFFNVRFLYQIFISNSNMCKEEPLKKMFAQTKNPNMDVHFSCRLFFDFSFIFICIEKNSFAKKVDGFFYKKMTFVRFLRRRYT